ncbi:MAG: DUF2806 domain-containing protein [Rhodobacteraceae bacterium]|nr:DUF2806 domain-containing protein [Paracoccaceae bacterium]MYI91449.1 DUF2806 domain-containing protein [Paracoccaceae bacterium]
MDINLNVKVPAIEKLIDYSASGIGAVAGSMLAPWKASREGKARIESTKADIQITELHETALLETRKRIENYDPLEQSGNLDNYVSERIQFQEQKRLANAKSVIFKAAQELGDKEVPDQEPDHDWTARFFSFVQDVSSEEMQILWAKILAGQVERPDSMSLRTLGVLQEMDRNTAELFEKFCSMCMFLETHDGVYDGRICSLGKNAGDNSLESFGLNFGKLNQLQEYGLIISDYNSWRNYSIPEFEKYNIPLTSVPFRFQNNLWILTQVNTDKHVREIKITGPSLSISGQELSRVVECKPAPEFTEKLQGFLQTKNLRMMEVNTIPKG